MTTTMMTKEGTNVISDAMQRRGDGGTLFTGAPVPAIPSSSSSDGTTRRESGAALPPPQSTIKLATEQKLATDEVRGLVVPGPGEGGSSENTSLVPGPADPALDSANQSGVVLGPSEGIGEELEWDATKDFPALHLYGGRDGMGCVEDGGKEGGLDLDVGMGNGWDKDAVEGWELGAKDPGNTVNKGKVLGDKEGDPMFKGADLGKRKDVREKEEGSKGGGVPQIPVEWVRKMRRRMRRSDPPPAGNSLLGFNTGVGTSAGPAATGRVAKKRSRVQASEGRVILPPVVRRKRTARTHQWVPWVRSDSESGCVHREPSLPSVQRWSEMVFDGRSVDRAITISDEDPPVRCPGGREEDREGGGNMDNQEERNRMSKDRERRGTFEGEEGEREGRRSGTEVSAKSGSSGLDLPGELLRASVTELKVICTDSLDAVETARRKNSNLQGGQSRAIKLGRAKSREVVSVLCRRALAREREVSGTMERRIRELLVDKKRVEKENKKLRAEVEEIRKGLIDLRQELREKEREMARKSIEEEFRREKREGREPEENGGETCRRREQKEREEREMLLRIEMKREHREIRCKAEPPEGAWPCYLSHRLYAGTLPVQRVDL